MRILKTYGVVEVRPKVGATIVDNRMSSAIEMFSFNVMSISLETFSDIQGFRGLLEVSSVDLMTNNPKKINSLIHAGISVANRVPHVAVASEFAQEYIEVKKKRMGHLISDDEPKPQFCISIK